MEGVDDTKPKSRGMINKCLSSMREEGKKQGQKAKKTRDWDPARCGE